MNISVARSVSALCTAPPVVQQHLLPCLPHKRPHRRQRHLRRKGLVVAHELKRRALAVHLQPLLHVGENFDKFEHLCCAELARVGRQRRQVVVGVRRQEEGELEALFRREMAMEDALRDPERQLLRLCAREARRVALCEDDAFFDETHRDLVERSEVKRRRRVRFLRRLRRLRCRPILENRVEEALAEVEPHLLLALDTEVRGVGLRIKARLRVECDLKGTGARACAEPRRHRQLLPRQLLVQLIVFASLGAVRLGPPPQRYAARDVPESCLASRVLREHVQLVRQHGEATHRRRARYPRDGLGLGSRLAVRVSSHGEWPARQGRVGRCDP
mmetsp:Transcript_28168/g.61680  ORF Transcript_28168/g.61680 Transcript_28168/m.61680 type:complete len:331 (+) Transcript_28168:916-1908(+)